MSVGRIENTAVTITVTKRILKFINSIDKKEIENAPKGIKNLQLENGEKLKKYLMTDKDYKILNQITDGDKSHGDELKCDKLNLEDLRWVYEKIQEFNREDKKIQKDNNQEDKIQNDEQIEINEEDKKLYLHELLEGSEIILPQNKIIPRNPDLEKRCNTLKVQQENMRYKNMTKNVDSVRRGHPEDSISYQVKQLNRQLIAVGQFIVSVLAGFAFGFIGLEYVLGNLDFGFRLLLGIICALVIALAELYFLAKKLNEEAYFETKSHEMSKHSKID